MQLVNTEKLLSELYIVIHILHILVYSLYQIGVYLGRNLVIVERCLQCTVIMPCLGVEIHSLRLCPQSSRNSVFELVIGVVHSLKGVLSEHPVLRLHKRHIASVSYLMLNTVLVLSIRVAKVGIGKHREYILGGSSKLSRKCQYTLLPLREDMSLLLSHSVKVQPVKLKLGLSLVKALKGLIIDRNKLGCRIAGCRIDLGVNAHKLTEQLLIVRICSVLVGASLSIVRKAVRKNAELIV